MENISGYTSIEEISRSSNSLIYRALDEKSGKPVILKISNRQHPSAEEVSRFYREYDLLKLFSDQGLVEAYDRLTVHDSPAIALEDFGGDSLTNLLPTMKLSLEEFLTLAIRISEIIGNIHRRNIIHKDINPSNILWNTAEGSVRVIDLGIATELSREITSVKNPNVMEGTLAYISPEQTGRMNRSLDYRTDFYSLGATFYWMLTGRLPFDSDDLLKLVHSHIAVEPKSPHSLDATIPETVSRIVMKLMAKNAEDRYLSAHGLKIDLERCLNELKKDNTVSAFKLASHDVSERFEISQKLYGREEEISSLMRAFKRVSEGSFELMLVSGFAGIGKSVLINEIQRPVVKHRGYFCTGKFEQLKRDVPFNAIIQAFSALGRQILGEDQQEIDAWKNKLTTALGPNGKIITDIFPLFELIIGKQPDLPAVGPVESQNRFNRVFQDFIKTIADREHPLVVFLDDLHWADSASLYLLEVLASDFDLKHFLIIGAYRHNETSVSHPLMLTIDEIKQTGLQINSMFLNPLKLESVNQLLMDTMNCTGEDSLPLAEVLIEKTGGNPFFINEFLGSLYKKGLIQFSFDSGWSWDMPGIRNMDATDNVVDLIAGKISDLPPDSQEMLRLASCLGSSFDPDTIVTVSGKSKEEIESALMSVMKNGMLNLVDGTYRFSHDRVFEAAYSLVPDSEKAVQHYKIGNLFLANSDEAALEENIFYIVNQFNAGLELVKKKDEKEKLVEMNLLAGKKALASNAYASALNYLKTGIGLLREDAWQGNYKMTLELHQAAVTAADLSGSFTEMELLSDAILSKAKTFLDTISTYETIILSLVRQNRMSEGLTMGRKALKKLGVRYPEKPGMLRILLSILAVKFKLWGRSLDKLLELPDMTDTYKKAIMHIMPGLGSSAYTTSPDLMPLIISDTVKLSVKYGNNSYSPFAFAALGMIHCSALGDIDKGVEYGSFALRLLDKMGSKDNSCDAMFVYWCFIHHWKKPIREALQPYLDIYKTGLEIGDFSFAAVSVNAYSCNLLYAGVELETVDSEMVKYTDAIEKLNDMTILNLQKIQHQTVLNLQGKNDDPRVLNGTAYNQDEMLPVHEKAKDSAALFAIYYFLLNLNYLFDDYEAALKYLNLSKVYEGGATSSPYIPLLNFYDSLVHLALCRGSKKSRQRKYLRIVSRNQRKMKKWSLNSPENYSHKYHLVEAELARLAGEEKKARRHYEQAISLARKNQFIQEQALACELLGNFWLDLEEENAASLYLSEALAIYNRWGAAAKVSHLEKKYKRVLKTCSENTAGITRTSTTGTSSTGSTASFDLATVMKTSQTLSSEIDLHKLLQEVMRLSIENAGAQRGFLILENEENNKLYIEAEGRGEKNISVLQSIPVDESPDLSQAVVRYASRTGESVVLNDAHAEGDFANDPYIKEKGIRSLLCTPVTHKGKTQGLLYLENNLTTSAFTPGRIELLQLISSQAAISIENARLLIDREKALDVQTRMAGSFARFVPKEFLNLLNKQSIVEVELGNQVQKKMTVLFSDIRAFTSLSEKMTPQENFNFLNSFLKRIGPVIRSNGGFIDKYIGDAVMALFPDSPEDAVDAAIMMHRDTLKYNEHRKASSYDEIEIGVGLHYGNLMLGTIGEESRMEGTVISDDVNLASRIEGLTKYYGSDILVSGTLFNRIAEKGKYDYRIIDTVIVKGRSEPVTLIEILDPETCRDFDYKMTTKSRLVEAIKLYREKEISKALSLFQELSGCCDGRDNVIEIYIKRCRFLLARGIPEGWNGIEKLESK